MIYDDLVQGSADWLAQRAGCVTGSRVYDILPQSLRIAGGKPDKYLKSREDYMLEIAYERISGLHFDHFVTKAMEDGIDREPLAKAAYEDARGVAIEEIGFATHEHIDDYGASPDGLVEDGCIEVKCPTLRTHMEWLLAGDVPPEYIPQMKAVMSCTGRKWCDFISYVPPDRGLKKLGLFIRRLEFDKEMIEKQDAEVVRFLKEAAELEARLRKMKL